MQFKKSKHFINISSAIMFFCCCCCNFAVLFSIKLTGLCDFFLGVNPAFRLLTFIH